ncbi:MAG: cryptochrome/photolyase family protein, partial [Cyanobacteria bacterium P01_D01_bin.128]
MTTGVWVLGNQLWAEQSAIASRAEQAEDTPVILIESLEYARERPYHQQKLVLVWSAMRHFAEELSQAGWPVTYEQADGFQIALSRWIEAKDITELRVMTPSDRPFAQLLNQLDLPCKLVQTPNNHFLWDTADFKEWANKRKSLLMESFYREGRKRFDVLMEGKDPVGDQWNFDKDNR